MRKINVEKEGFSVVRDFVGHGIGRKLHESPQIPNYGPPGQGVRLKHGMTLAIEPMITRGTAKTHVLADEWTVVSNDHSRGAHFENSFVLLPDGKPYVLTALDGGRAKLATLGVEVSDLLD